MNTDGGKLRRNITAKITILISFITSSDYIFLLECVCCNSNILMIFKGKLRPFSLRVEFMNIATAQPNQGTKSYKDIINIQIYMIKFFQKLTFIQIFKNYIKYEVRFPISTIYYLSFNT